MTSPVTRDTPRTDAFAGSCATYVALIAKKREDPSYKANMMELEFCLSLGHSNILEAELSEMTSAYNVQKVFTSAALKTVTELDDTLGGIAREFTALYEDSEKTDSVGEIYHLLRESGHLP